MGKEFTKLKKRFLIEAIVKSVICGTAAALFAVGAVLLGIKLAETDFNAGYYAVIAFAAFDIVGGGLFLFLRPTDKKIAKKLDEEHGLNERVQTMVAFADREGDMVELQRQDAAEKLAALPKRKFDIKKLWQYILIPVLALALFITAVAIPEKVAPPPPEIPFEYSDRQKAAVEQLIADVNESSLTDADKNSVTAMLQTMSESLEGIKTVREMKAAVLSAVAFIDIILYTSNSFDNVAYAIEDEKTAFLSGAITDGVLFFKSSSAAITNLEQVKALEADLTNSVGEKVDNDMDVFIQQYDVAISENLKDKVDEINKFIRHASNDSVAAKDDALRVSVENLLAEMEGIAENIDSFTDETVQAAIKAKINSFKDELVPALEPQSYRCIADEFIRRRTAQIFDINANELPRQNSGVQELDERDDDPDKNDDPNEGGVGKGELVAGSNEYVYDPDTGELVPYGQYINLYYAAMTEQLLNGEMPENLQEYIKKYFSILYSGTQPPQENDNKE